MQTLLDSAVAQRRIPGAIALIACGSSVRWLGTAGELAPGVPMPIDAIFPLASIGKMYTAVTAMALVEDGVIELDAPVGRYLPEFDALRVAVRDSTGLVQLRRPDQPVTLRHLLTHTAGLQLSGDAFWSAWNAHVGKTNTREFARALAALPMVEQPGRVFAYGATGASYEVLAAVLEAASARSLEALMQHYLFGPLDLRETHFYLPAELQQRLPAFYGHEGGALQLHRARGDDAPRSRYFAGGGGVSASPADLLRFLQLFVNDGAVDGSRILRPETVRAMMTDQLGPTMTMSGGRRWGYGAALRFEDASDGGRRLRQYGWRGGGYARAWVDPVTRLVAYVAFPLDPPGDDALLAEFERRVTAMSGVPATLPVDSAEQILDGAARALRTPTSAAGFQIHAEAAVEGPRGRFRTSVHSTSDGRALMRQDHSGFLAGVGHNGRWRRDPESGRIDSLGTGIAFLRGHELHMLSLAPRALFTRPRYLGWSVRHGHTVMAVALTMATGDSLIAYFNAVDTLPVAARYFLAEPPIDVDWEDWTEIDGVRLFRQARFRQGNDVFRYRYDTLRLSGIDSALFEPR